MAAAAGVSTQTVSRVLNERPDVAPATEARVRQVIRETGYAPNMVARSLTQGRSHVLGIVGFGLEYFGPSQLLTGIEEQAAEMGYAVTLNLVGRPERVDVGAVLGGLVARQVDGVIWAIPEVGDNRTWWHVGHPGLPVPVMLVGGMTLGSPLPSIGIDNRAIGRLATEHLLAGGARRMAIVTGPLGWWEARERLAGWREVLDAHGVPPADRLEVEGDWTATSGAAGLERLLEQAPDLDAVFASNDQMALGVLYAAHRIGRRVPDELSVIGADDMAESAHFWPALTTVRQPLRDAGALAVREIDGAIGRRRARRPSGEAAGPASRVLQPTLVRRESSRRGS